MCGGQNWCSPLDRCSTRRLDIPPDINPRLISSVRSISVQLWAPSLRSAFTLEQLRLIRAGELDAGVVILPVADDALTMITRG